MFFCRSGQANALITRKDEILSHPEPGADIECSLSTNSGVNQSKLERTFWTIEDLTTMHNLISSFIKSQSLLVQGLIVKH